MARRLSRRCRALGLTPWAAAGYVASTACRAATPWATAAWVASAAGRAAAAAPLERLADEGGDLAAARRLAPPSVEATKRGEFEGHEFWDEHDELLTRAWHEHGALCPSLYEFGAEFERRFLNRSLREAAARARKGDIAGEQAIRGLFEEVLPGVYASNALFTPDFLETLLAELEHIESSGIPQRRPNGMNRYGVILDQVGMEPAMQALVDAYIRPLAATMFPDVLRHEDGEEHYAFTVRYHGAGDTELAKHSDASVVTLNLCLGPRTWQGGQLEFFEYDPGSLFAAKRYKAGSGNVTFTPGMAVIHRGQHKHQALPLLEGERLNLIIWLMGRHGTVRIKPYDASEQLTAQERWQAHALGADNPSSTSGSRWEF